MNIIKLQRFKSFGTSVWMITKHPSKLHESFLIPSFIGTLSLLSGSIPSCLEVAAVFRGNPYPSSSHLLIQAIKTLQGKVHWTFSFWEESFWSWPTPWPPSHSLWETSTSYSLQLHSKGKRFIPFSQTEKSINNLSLLLPLFNVFLWGFPMVLGSECAAYFWILRWGKLQGLPGDFCCSRLQQ